ncbi:F167 [Hirschfeldia incana]|nr:F167 [Hirschfeldia incana]
MSSPDPKTTANSDSQSRINEAPPPSEELGDSSTVWKDPVESGSPMEEEPKQGGDAAEEEEEEEGECGFCLFMKGGGCKESFTAWEVCVEEAEKNKEDIVTKCMEITSTLKKCMDEHSDYYQPILAAEKAAEQQVKKELEAEKEKVDEDEAAAMKQAQG